METAKRNGNPDAVESLQSTINLCTPRKTPVSAATSGRETPATVVLTNAPDAGGPDNKHTLNEEELGSVGVVLCCVLCCVGLPATHRCCCDVHNRRALGIDAPKDASASWMAARATSAGMVSCNRCCGVAPFAHLTERASPRPTQPQPPPLDTTQTPSLQDFLSGNVGSAATAVPVGISTKELTQIQAREAQLDHNIAILRERMFPDLAFDQSSTRAALRRNLTKRGFKVAKGKRRRTRGQRKQRGSSRSRGRKVGFVCGGCGGASSLLQRVVDAAVGTLCVVDVDRFVRADSREDPHLRPPAPA